MKRSFYVGEKMIYLENLSVNPYFNLALEEYVLTHLHEEEKWVFFWQNQPSVIIGRFQNTVEEICLPFIEKHNISVVRRISGGGAVYHDLGNLNFSIIESQECKKFNMKKFVEPILIALAKVGVLAEISGRNDITINGRKCSGNAQYHFRDKTLHHGTILYDVNLDNLAKSLHVESDKFVSKSVKSVRNRVTNISEHMTEGISIVDFKKVLLDSFYGEEPLKKYELSLEDIKAMEALMKDKYLTWEWNYGCSPPFNFRKKTRFSWGGFDLRLFVERGIIKDCQIYGDFFSSEEIQPFTEKWIGCPFKIEDLHRTLNEEEIKKHVGDISKNELLTLIFA